MIVQGLWDKRGINRLKETMLDVFMVVVVFVVVVVDEMMLLSIVKF